MRSEPRVITVDAGSAHADPRVQALVDRVRERADVFVFLSGGAEKITDADQRRLLSLLHAFRLLAEKSIRLAVGDGGTRAGIMEAAGLVRKASGNAFELIGVVPVAEIPPRGTVEVDPHHSDVVAVERSDWDAADGWWGSETATMFEIFARIAEGRPSVAIAANGGAVTLTEIDENIRAGRPIVVLAGSGRAADAVVALLKGTVPVQSEISELYTRAAAARLARRPELFHVIDLSTTSASSLAEILADRLGVAR